MDKNLVEGPCLTCGESSSYQGRLGDCRCDHYLQESMIEAGYDVLRIEEKQKREYGEKRNVLEMGEILRSEETKLPTCQ